MIVDELHDLQHRVEVVLHVRHLDVADRAAGGERLELRLEGELIEGVDMLGDVNVVGVRDVVLVRDALDEAEALLQALGKFIRRGLQRCSVEREVDVGRFLPALARIVHVLHNFKRKRRSRRVGVRFSRHVLDALVKARVAERDRRIAAVEELVDRLALFEPRERAILPEDRRGVRERALETVVAAHEGLVAELEPFVENLPELIKRAAGRERHVHKVDGHHALIEPAVILGLVRIVVSGVRHIVPAVAGAVGREEAAAAHAGVHVAMARRFALGELELFHFLLGNVVRHHALCCAAGGKLCEVPELRALGDVVLFQHVNELRECGGDPHALLVLHTLNALVERFFDDDGKVLLLLLASSLAEVHEDRDKRRLSVRRHKRHDLILDGLHAAADLIAQPLFNDLGDGFIRGLGAEVLELL